VRQLLLTNQSTCCFPQFRGGVVRGREKKKPGEKGEKKGGIKKGVKDI